MDGWIVVFIIIIKKLFSKHLFEFTEFVEIV